MLLAEPTYNRTRPIALAWRARILSQKALRNVSRITFSSAFWPPSQKSEERAHSSPGAGTQVGDLAQQLEGLREGASDAQEPADTQQERIDLAARELAEVSDHLQAAANALRASI